MSLTGTAVAVSGGAAIALGANHGTHVDLVVDGHSQPVETTAHTVADLLTEEGLSVGPHDSLIPAANTTLRDGEDVILRHGQQLTFTIDGVRHQAWVTATTVQDALDELGIRDARSFVSVSRSQPLGRQPVPFDIRTMRSVTVIADGVRYPVDTTAATVADALAQAGIRMGPQDTASVPLEMFPTAGMTITVHRVTTETRTTTTPIPFPTTVRTDPNQPVGSRSIVTPGVPGESTTTTVVQVIDGHPGPVVSSTTTTTREPVPQVIRLGTRAPAYSAGHGSGSAGSGNAATGAGAGGEGANWAALSQCESGGNPHAVDPSGHYFGLYQFSPQTWHSLGGQGLPSDASPAEQTARAKQLLARSGPGQWPVCGRRLGG